MVKFLSVLVVVSFSPVFSQEVKSEPAFEFLSKYQNVRDFALSSTGDEAYFTIQSPNDERAIIAFIKLENGKWSEPEMVSFCGTYRDIEPFLAADGLKLYFSSNRPLIDSDTVAKDYDIWYVERKDLKNTWSKPINLGKPVNTSANEFYPSLAKSGNLYYTSDATTAFSKDDIYLSKWNGKNYTLPKPLDNNINSEGYEFNAFVSPDESFILYTAYGRKDGLGSGDLYISRKDLKGNWREAVNLGTDINSPQMDYCPFFDFKTNMLYFTSKRNSISAKTTNSIKEFLNEIEQYEIGLSRIYKVKVPLNFTEETQK